MNPPVRRAAVAPFESSPPKPLEPVGGEFGVPHGMLDVLVPEVGLDRAGVVTVVRPRVPAAVAEHVGTDRKAHGGFSPVRERILRNPAAVIGPPVSIPAAPRADLLYPSAGRTPAPVGRCRRRTGREPSGAADAGKLPPAARASPSHAAAGRRSVAAGAGASAPKPSRR